MHAPAWLASDFFDYTLDLCHEPAYNVHLCCTSIVLQAVPQVTWLLNKYVLIKSKQEQNHQQHK